jgi:uncharacterized protein YukE
VKYIRTLTSFVLMIVLAIIVVGIWKHQAIQDWWALRNYTPPTRVVKLADETTMLADTRKLFYINHPSLDEKIAFNGHCRAGDRTVEQSIVLGCYIGNKGIFLLDVNDPRLNGVVEVTAAHETLHAAYERLSAKEKARVDSMTNSFFAGLSDERIKATVESYRKKDASVVPNELHSILGTEVENLPPELETYYAQYFGNRKQIVAFSKQYEQAFVERRTQVEQYDKQLNALKNQISANQAALEQQSAQLDADRRRLDDLLTRNQTAAYNAAVPDFNQQVNQYNVLVQQTRQMVNQYNDLVEKRNALATQEQELIQAIDSNFTTEQQH